MQSVLFFQLLLPMCATYDCVYGWNVIFHFYSGLVTISHYQLIVNAVSNLYIFLAYTRS